jgi:hypothetical protein
MVDTIRLTGGGPLAALRLRFRAGQAVRLDEVVRAAGLTAQERLVVRGRLDGRSFGHLAGEGALRKAGGGAFTRQRMQQVERLARRKLGLAQSIDRAVHADEAAGRAEALADRGAVVRVADLRADPGAIQWRRRPRWELEHEAAVRAFLQWARR